MSIRMSVRISLHRVCGMSSGLRRPPSRGHAHHAQSSRPPHPTRTCMHACTHACTHARTHACIPHVHAHTHARIHARTHSCIHASTQARKHAQARPAACLRAHPCSAPHTRPLAQSCQTSGCNMGDRHATEWVDGHGDRRVSGSAHPNFDRNY